MFMANLKPHIAIILIVISIVTFGVLTNSGQIGSLSGHIVGVFEPLILFAGVIAGLAKSYKKLLIHSLIISIIVIAYIQYQVFEWQAQLQVSMTMSKVIYVCTIRYIDILLIAHLVNIPVALRYSKSEFKVPSKKPIDNLKSSNTFKYINNSKIWLICQIIWVLLVILTAKYRSYPDVIYLFHSFIGPDIRTNGFVQVVVMAFPFLTNLYFWIKK